MTIELEKIQLLVTELNSLKPLKLEYQKELDKKFRLEFNYNSNHLEGNTLTYSETKLLLIFDDTKGDHTLREYEEMKGSDVAYELIMEWAKEEERTLSEKDIKQLNEILLVRPLWKDAITPDGQQTRRLIKVGDYKEFPNSVRLSNGELFEYASPIDTPILMGELIQWFREESSKRELHPVVLAALFHYKFVRIHPFDDGNGRISRLLMNYVLFKNDLPPIIIKSEESEKRKYLSALNKADTGDLDSFVQFIAQQQISSLELAIKAAKGGSLDEPGDFDKKIKLLKQKLKADKDEIKIVKSKESVLEIFTITIEPLFLKLVQKLEEFDSLFKSKSMYFIISISNGGYYSNLKQIKEWINANSISNFNYLYFRYELLNFRKGNKQFSVEVEFKVHFHQLVYEIQSEEINYSIDKLYHQNLSEVEVDDFIEKMGTSLLNKIEAKIGS